MSYFYSLYYSYEVLIKEEKSTFLEIQALEKKYESWAKVELQVQRTGVPAVTKKPLSSARDVTVDLPPEVAKFDVSIFFFFSFN